jgi:hypothetical protein
MMLIASHRPSAEIYASSRNDFLRSDHADPKRYLLTLHAGVVESLIALLELVKRRIAMSNLWILRRLCCGHDYLEAVRINSVTSSTTASLDQACWYLEAFLLLLVKSAATLMHSSERRLARGCCASVRILEVLHLFLPVRLASELLPRLLPPFKLIGTFYLRRRIALCVLAPKVLLILLRLLIAGILIIELRSLDSTRIGLRPRHGWSLRNSYQLLSAIGMLY